MNLIQIAKKFNLSDVGLNKLFVAVRTKLKYKITKEQELQDEQLSIIMQFVEKHTEMFPLNVVKEAPQEKKTEKISIAPGTMDLQRRQKIKGESESKKEEQKPESPAQKKKEKQSKKSGEKAEAKPSEKPAEAKPKSGKQKKLTREQLRALEKERRDAKREKELKKHFVKMLQKKKKRKKKVKVQAEISNIRKVPSGQTVSTLATILGIEPSVLIEKLNEMGETVTLSQQLDDEIAYTIASEYDIELDFVNPEYIFDEEEPKGKLEPRPAVVTVMGHVDHGKTTLLDTIRKTKVASSEAGGITQSIGAYQVKIKDKKITFIDTPGHQAFTAMRSRGAKVTDIVVLIVAADDGVMPQTVEAINHAKAAEVPIIVAINKIDRPNANIDKVKKELSENGILPEDWGGDVPCVNISAKEGTGIDELLEYIILQSEMRELKTNPAARATGFILEARIDKGQGPVATVILNNGTLRKGDYFVVGNIKGKVRLILDDKSRAVAEAGAADAVEIVGFEEVPNAGDKFEVVPDEKTAKNIVQKRKELIKTAQTSINVKPAADLDSFFAQAADTAEKKVFNVIIKGDVIGSVEAVMDALLQLNSETVTFNVVHFAAGAVSESDVVLAVATKSLIIAFNTNVNSKAKQLLETEKAVIKQYRIIYELLEDMSKLAAGTEVTEIAMKQIGTAEVRQIFKVSKTGTVAGSFVRDGVVRRNAIARVIRNDSIAYEGKIKSVRHFKEDVKEVTKNFECGIAIENYNDLHAGDVLEIYEIEE